MLPVSWKNLFSPVILGRGRQVFESGAVLNLESTGPEAWKAVVRGTTEYKVTAAFHRQRAVMSCTCLHARSGWRCKHMAALLFALEKHESQEGARVPAPAAGRQEKASFPVPLFPPEDGDTPETASPPGEDTFRNSAPLFDLRQIMKGCLLPEAVLESARRLVSSRQVRINDLAVSQPGAEKLLARFAVPGDSRYAGPVQTQIELNRRSVLYAGCMGTGALCKKTRTRDGALCHHLAASFLLLERFLAESSPFDTTDRTGDAVLRRFGTGFGPTEEAGEGRDIALAPVLEILEETRWRLMFRIGIGRMVYCASLPELTEAIRTRGAFSLGASGTIRFGSDRFDSRSAKLAEFLCRWTENDQAHAQLYGEGSAYSAGALPLYGERLDDFFDLCRDAPLPVRGARSKPLTLTDGLFRPAATVSLMREDGRLSGATVEGECPETVMGRRFAYCLDRDGNTLVRMDAEPVRQWKKHFPGLNGLFFFRIGRNNLPDFYRRIMPFIRENADVTESEEDAALLARWLPPKLRITFYLDAEDDRSTCRIEAAYGEEVFTLLPGPETPAPWREVFREMGALRAAETLFPETDRERGLLYRGRDDQFTYDLLTNGLHSLEQWGTVLATDRFSAIRIRRNFQVQAGVKLNSGLMDLEVTCGGLTEEELLEILKAYDPRKKWHRLKNGDFVDLEDPGIESLLSLMDAAHVSPKEFVKGKMHLPAYRALYLDALLKERQDIAAARDSAFRHLIRTFRTVSESDFEVPETLRQVLRPYQTAGFQWIMTLTSAGFGGILADDMGLGKTVQMIAVFLYDKERPDGAPALPSLVVCPASLVYNWEAEIQRFAPQLKVAVAAGPAAERHRVIARAAESDVLITSYDLLKRDADLYEDLSFRYQVLDEAQYIKTASSAAAKSCKIIRAAHRFAMTGTPIENNLSELWSIFDYLMPGFLYDYPFFRKTIELPAVKNGRADALERLKKMVSPFLMRRLKKDVLKDLPDKMEETRTVVLEEEQSRLYSAQVVRLRQFISGESDEDFSKDRIRVLAELTRLRQICCDPSLIAENYAGQSAKREALKDLLAEASAGGHKVLVFSQFTSMLSLIAQDLKARETPFYLLTGATPKAERVRMCAAFNRDGVPVFLISLKAGGTGLNLTGADIVVHYDPWWNAAAASQATDRAHRIGQEKTVTVYTLVCKNTIEEQIVALQKNKQELAEEVLEGGNTAFSRLSREDLLALLDG